MAITKLNSLAIPDDTIVEADLSYPLTNFSSTGIDDNASSTAVTIDANEQIGVGTIIPDAVLHAAKTQASGDVPIILENSGTSGVVTASLVFAGSGGGGAEKARIKSAVYGDGYMTFHTNDDSEKMRLDASGNLGVGTDSVTNKLEVDGGSSPVFARISTTNAGGKVAGLILANSSKTAFNDGVKISHGGGFTTFDDLAGTTNFVINQTNGRVGIGETNPDYVTVVSDTSNATRLVVQNTNNAQFGCGVYMRVFSGGSLVSQSTITNDNAGNLKFFTGTTTSPELMRLLPSGGITFNGDTAAANALDDYEEGTWSPTLPNGGSITVNRAVYTKVGRLVIANLYISISSIPNDSADFRIGNLPFNSGIATDYGGGSLSYAANRDVRGWSDPLVLQQASVLYFHFLDGTTGNPVKNTNVVSSLVATLIAQVVYFAS